LRAPTQATSMTIDQALGRFRKLKTFTAHG
jgi:hypothetical protein